MREKLLEGMREQLYLAKEKVENHNKKVDRIKELLNDDKIKEFISLTKININDINLDKITETEEKENIINDLIAFLNINMTSNTNNIYFYMGDFEGKYEKNGRYGYLIKSNNQKLRLKKPTIVKVYRNIENSNDQVILPVNQCNEFEKENIIITSNDYYDTQKEFVKDALETNQEDAVKRLVKKYQK